MYPPACIQTSAELPVLHTHSVQQAGEVLSYSLSHPVSCWGPFQRKMYASTCLHLSQMAAEGAERSNLVMLVFTWYHYSEVIYKK